LSLSLSLFLFFTLSVSIFVSLSREREREREKETETERERERERGDSERERDRREREREKESERNGFHIAEVDDGWDEEDAATTEPRVLCQAFQGWGRVSRLAANGACARERLAAPASGSNNNEGGARVEDDGRGVGCSIMKGRMQHHTSCDPTCDAT